MSGDIAALIQAADELWNDDECDRAIEMLEGAVGEDPDNVVLLSRLGRYYYEWWRFVDSLRTLQRARALSPDDREVLMYLGISLLELEHAEDALSVFERLCELYPDDRQARRNHALTLIKLGRPDEALPRLEELVRDEPDHPPHRVVLGRALNRMGRYREAVALLEDVTGTHPDLEFAWVELADGYLGQRRTASWRRAVARAYELTEREPEVLVRHSKVCHDLDHDPDGAIAACKRALSVNPNSVAAHTAFAELAWHHGEWEAAEERLTAAVALAPWNGTVVGVLARFRAVTGRGPLPLDDLERMALETPYSGLAGHLGRICCEVLDLDGQEDVRERAVRLLEVAARADVENAEIHHYLAVAYYTSRRFADAAEESERAVTLSPGYGEAWLWLGYSRTQLDQELEAVEALERGIAEHPRDPQARRIYGRALDAIGRRSQAVEQYLMALPYTPKDGTLLYNLANSYYEQGLLDEARPYAERARENLPADDPEMAELLRLLDAAGR